MINDSFDIVKDQKYIMINDSFNIVKSTRGIIKIIENIISY